MLSDSELLLFLRELDRLLIDLINCSDTQASNHIYQDIQLLRNAIAWSATD